MKKLLLYLSFLFTFCLNAQWTELSVPNNMYLYGSNFVTDNTGFLFSQNGYLQRTADGGQTWDSIGTPYIYSWINTAHFITPNLGFIAGGANFPFPPSSISDLILKTTDQGLSFDSVYGSLSGSDIVDIDFADEMNGIFLGSFNSFKTSDGGASIDSLYFGAAVGTFYQSSDIEFVDLQNAYVLAHTYIGGVGLFQRKIFKSVDQGANWTQIFMDTISNTNSQLSFVNGNLGFMAGSEGSLFKTTNGGQTWTESIVNPTLVFSNIVFANANTGFIVAQANNESYFYSSVDGGDSWQLESIDTNFVVNRISLTENFVFVSDELRVFKRNIDSFEVAIRPSFLQNQLSAYPNPSRDKVFIEGLEDYQLQNYQVLDLSGKLLSEGKITESILELNLAAYSTGIYTFIISDGIKPLAFTKLLIE